MSALLAAEGVVNTKDGLVYRGDVTEKQDSVVIAIRGVQTVVPKSQVASIEYVGNYDQEFHARLSKREAQDVVGRIAMAREAFDRHNYSLARLALEQAIQIDPNSAEATELLRLVERQIGLERSRIEPGGGTQTPKSPAARQPAADRHLLTAADVETIRRSELKDKDTGVRIRFDGDVKKRFTDSQNKPFADFSRLGAVEQALAIFKDGDDSMRDKVRVLSDPPSMLEYRRQIQPLVLQNCATAGCHTGGSGSGLILFTPADTDQITYTNFYILQTYSRKIDSGGGVFGSSEKKLIDRGRAEQSLLVNYALPIAIAEFDHPLVNGKPIQALLRNKEDARYKLLVDWMNKSLVQIEPRYRITYTPPTAAPVTRPATQPTTGPTPDAK